MTREEAIRVIKAMGQTFIGDNTREATKLAIEALEKQIPKKVEWTENELWGVTKKQPVCPVCDYYLTATYFNESERVIKGKITYCDHCGQAIDWSVLND